MAVKKQNMIISSKDSDPVRNDPGYESIPRQKQNAVPMGVRWDIDKEVELGFSKENASKEADRCLLCHYNIFIDEKCVLCGGMYRCLSAQLYRNDFPGQGGDRGSAGWRNSGRLGCCYGYR